VTANQPPKWIGGATNKSISKDCREDRHEVCIHKNCDCCHEGQVFVHGHWKDK